LKTTTNLRPTLPEVTFGSCEKAVRTQADEKELANLAVTKLYSFVTLTLLIVHVAIAAHQGVQ
jgi:hypothetical protein